MSDLHSNLNKVKRNVSDIHNQIGAINLIKQLNESHSNLSIEMEEGKLCQEHIQ